MEEGDGGEEGHLGAGSGAGGGTLLLLGRGWVEILKR